MLFRNLGTKIKNECLTKQINAEPTNSLSAKGSINFPKFETKLYFLAKYPSKKSDKHATQNTTQAVIY